MMLYKNITLAFSCVCVAVIISGCISIDGQPLITPDPMSKNEMMEKIINSKAENGVETFYFLPNNRLIHTDKAQDKNSSGTWFFATTKRTDKNNRRDDVLCLAVGDKTGKTEFRRVYCKEFFNEEVFGGDTLFITAPCNSKFKDKDGDISCDFKDRTSGSYWIKPLKLK